MKNKVYLMDNIRLLNDIPNGIIDLIYIDPPYFSQTHHSDFNDKWKSLDEYLDFMKIRIKEMHRVLDEKGCFWIQCDSHAKHYLKVMIDDIFGYNNFKVEITWKRTKATKTVNKNFGLNTDALLFYVKSEDYTFNMQYKDLTKKQIERDYQKEEETGRYFTHYKLYGYIERNPIKELYFKDKDKKIKAPKGYGFYWSQEYLDKKLKENPNCIYWTKNGHPRAKTYLDEHKGIPLNNIWDDIDPIPSTSSEQLDYRTQKPERLLERIIKICSNEEDLIADFFCGSGTTLAVAKRLRRNYIGCDINPKAIEITKRRLKNINVFENILNYLKGEEK